MIRNLGSRRNAVLVVLLALAAAHSASGQTSEKPFVGDTTHERYRVVDVGTFGGPTADTLVPPPAAHILSNSGFFIGSAETKLPDPFRPNCFENDCLVTEGLLNFAGHTLDIGTLRQGYSGGPFAVNNFGVAVGWSQDGTIDALTGSPTLRAALWKLGRVVDLGTLGGNGGSANAINDSGQIFGGALNTTPDTDSGDPFFIPGATQAHATLWEHGQIHDLGTLGGADSVVYQANNAGQAMGISFTDATRHDSTGLPTTHPFLWEHGVMHDVGSLGGNRSDGYGMNERGDVVGVSKLQGDSVSHPFFWRRGVLTDLGTLGGANGSAWSVNDMGDVVGRADLSDNLTHHAFLWRGRRMIDLGTPHHNACSTGESINRFDQVVGDSGECGEGGDPFLWEKGEMVALSDLILPGSNRVVYDAFQINDRGEIVSLCAPPEGYQHVCLLYPVHGSSGQAKQNDAGAGQIPSALHSRSGERRAGGMMH